MAKRELSAKEKAFKRDLDKLRHEINETNDEVNRLRNLVRTKNKEIDELNATIEEQKDWIERLLEYMKLDDNDLKNVKEIIKENKLNQDRVKHTLDMLDIVGNVLR